MDLQAEKLKLIQAILDIDDITLIKEVEEVIRRHAPDWFDDLTEEQQQSILRGLEQAEKGEKISNEEAVAKLGL